MAKKNRRMRIELLMVIILLKFYGNFNINFE